MKARRSKEVGAGPLRVVDGGLQEINRAELIALVNAIVAQALREVRDESAALSDREAKAA